MTVWAAIAHLHKEFASCNLLKKQSAKNAEREARCSLLIVLFLILAPVQETSVGRYANEKGCYYFNKHYSSGENIHTNEPCLNCTCVGSTLMCYLRVCPMVKPLGANCKSVMHVGDCCPQFWCPEGCFLDDKYYDEGARIPMDPMKPCEVCYCIRNTSVCTTQECELKVDGCFPQYKAGMCCPSRYNCTEDAATTIPPGVMEPEEYEGCKVGGVLYKDGEQVPSLDECENCYCMKHEVVCAVQECKAPADNCVPQATPEGQCCPDKYDCPSGTEIPEWATTHMVATEDLLRNVTTPVDLEHKFTSTAGLTTPAIKIQDHTLFTERDLDTQTLSVVLSTISDAKTITAESAKRVEDAAAETTTAEVTSLSELFTETVITENATLHPADFVSRLREPKITEVPDEMFSSVTIANATTGRPIFYRPGIPGEGICRQNDVIYQNREEVPSIDPCRLNCRCVNSVIKCDHVECMLSPPGTNCKVTRDPEECCPKYVCDTPADITTASDQFTHIPTVIQQEQEQITISDVLKAADKGKTTITEKAVTSKQEQEEITFKEESITESAIKFTTLSSSISSPTKETSQKEVGEVDFTPTVMSFTSTESKTEVSEAKIATVVSEVPVMTGVKSTESTEASKFTDIEKPSKATESVEIVTLEDGNVVTGMKEETTVASTVRFSTATPSTLTESPKTSIIIKEEEIVTPTAISLTTTLKESSEGIFIEATSRPSEELATDSEIEIKADGAKATSVAEDITSMKSTTEEAVTSKSTVEITGVVQENGTERTQSLEIEMSTAVTSQTIRYTESASGLTVKDAGPSEVTKLVSEGMTTKPKEVESVTQQTAKEHAFEESTSKSITETVKTSDITIEEKEKVGIESATVETLAAQTTEGPAGFDSTPKLATEMSTVENISESVSEELKTEKMKVEGLTSETLKDHAITELASKLTTVEIEPTTEVTQAISEELSTEIVSIQSLAPQTAKDTAITGSTPKTTRETSVSVEEITKTITDSVSTEKVDTETLLAEATTVLESAPKDVTQVTPSEGTSKAISDELSTEDVKAVASDSQIANGSETEKSKSTTKLEEISDKIIKDKGEVSTESALIIQDAKAPSLFDHTLKSTTAIPTASEGITESVSVKLSTEKMKDEVLTSETSVTESASELTIAEEKSTKQVTQTIREELSTEIMEVQSLAPEIAKEISAPNVTIQAEVSPEEVTNVVTERVSTESVVAKTSDARAIETTSVIGYTSEFKTESTQPSEKTTKPIIEEFSPEGLKIEAVTSQTTKEPETLELTSKLSTEKIIPSIETTKVTSSEVITEITQAGTIVAELTTVPTIFSSTSKILTTDAVSHETTIKVTEKLSLETLEPESIVPETATELEIMSSTPKSTAEMISEEATKSISESTESVKIELFTSQAAKEPGSLESDLKSTIGGESTEKTTKITTKKTSTEISEDETIPLPTTKEHVFVKSITTEAASPARETTKSVSQEESTDFADTEATIPINLDSTFKLTTGDVTSSDEAPEAVSKDTDTESAYMESFTTRVTKEPATSKLTTEEAESTKEPTKVVSTETIEAKIVTPQTSKESVSKLATKMTTESTETVREITKAESEETSSHSADIETLEAETTEMPKILDFTSELTTDTAESLEEGTKAVSLDLEAKPFTLHSTQDTAIIETTSELAPKETESSKESTSFVSEVVSEKVSDTESVVPQTAKKTTVFEMTTKLTTKAAEPLGQTTQFVSEEASTFSVGTEIKESETTEVPSLLDYTSKLATQTIESSKEVTKPLITIEGFESSTEHAVTELTSRLTTEQKTPTQETTKITEDVSTRTLSPQTITAVATSAIVTTEKSSSMAITSKDISEEISTVSADTEMKVAETTKPTVLDISSKLTIEETELSEGTTYFSKDLITESFETESVTPQTKESTVTEITSKLTTDESTNEADGIITKISEDTSLASQTVKEPIVIESTVKLTTEADVHLEETTKSMKEDGRTVSVVTETVKAEATKAPVIEDATSKLVTEKAKSPEELTESDSKDLITDSMVVDSFTTQTSRKPSIVELTSKVTIDEAKSTTEAAELVSGEVRTKTLTAESVAPQTAKEAIAVESTTKLTTEKATGFGETTKVVTEEPSTLVSEILKTEATKSSAVFESTFKLTTKLVPSSEEATQVISTDLSPEAIETQSFTPKTTEVPIIVESTSKVTVQKTEVTEETIKHISEEVSTETAKTETIVPHTAKEPEHVESTTKLATEVAAPLGGETKSEEVATSSVDIEILHTEATKPPSFDIASKLGTEKTEPSESTTELSSKHISTETAEFELSTSKASEQPVVVESTTKLTIEETESLESKTETSSKDITTQTSEFESATVKSTTKLTLKEAEPTKESTQIISLDVSAETIEAESIAPQTTKKPSVSKSTTKFTTESSAAVTETTKVISEETSIHSVDIETKEAEATKPPEKSIEEPAAVASVDVTYTTSKTKSIISQTSKEPLTVESTVKLTTEVSSLAAETTKSVSEEESSSSVLETEATKAPEILEFTSTLTSKEIKSSELTKAVSEDISTESVITESFRPQTGSESVTMKTTSELIIQDVKSTTETSKTVSEELSIKSLEDETIVPQTSTVEVTSKPTTNAIGFSGKETSATHTMKTSAITESISELTTEATVLPKEIIKDIGDDAISTESEIVGTFLSETTKAPTISEFDAEEPSTESVGAQFLASRTTKKPTFVQDISKLTTEAAESVTITSTSVESSSHLTSEVKAEGPEIISSTFKPSSKKATVVPLEETRSVSEMTSTDAVDIKSITQSTSEEPTSVLTRLDEASGETTRAVVEDITHELRTATTKLSEEIYTHEAEVKLTTFRPADTEETTKPEIKIITELPVTPDEETWKSEIKNQTKETAETDTKLPKFTTVEVISSETTSSTESETFTKQPTVSTAFSTEALKIEVTHKLPSTSPEVDDEIHELTTLKTLSKITQKSEAEDAAFKLTTKSDIFTEAPKIALSEITEVPFQKVTESALLEETTFKTITEDIEQITKITTLSQTIKSSETPKSTPEFEIEHPMTLKHTEIDSEALETTKYMAGVTSKTTAFASLDDSRNNSINYASSSNGKTISTRINY
ncbi:mucin-3A-like [Stegodyphus dumicola]|uniref:mucin-3A-like n=1 Tax=Stegodyphus dumicola TaxID=202533 RepID=UPI0015AE0F89|nr:mucin-3A-like [Stegodyphus dumicola]